MNSITEKHKDYIGNYTYSYLLLSNLYETDIMVKTTSYFMY